jgi:glycosyltransferase involved in cell wall biosynthesis
VRPPACRPRLAFVVSHPIQYYVPLYRRLVAQGDFEVRVFYTWHGGTGAVLDRGFGKKFAWDIPLTEGYAFEVVPNVAREPGTHHFWGLRNPDLLARVRAWWPDAVHLTGYAYASHLAALRGLAHDGVPVLFRGDSHLLDDRRGWRWQVTKRLLRRVYRWPAAFLYVGQANRRYYEALGVPAEKLFSCPHSIEVERFAEPHAEWEADARRWRSELGLGRDERVLLFAGKFEPKKRPVELMGAFLREAPAGWRLVMVGDGPLGALVRGLAELHPERFVVLPFQNQSRMPAVYRLGDLFVLPSAYAETWGLAVNEALACGRPVLVSDRVGCAEDVVRPESNGWVFRHDDWDDFGVGLRKMDGMIASVNTAALRQDARRFDIPATEANLLAALEGITNCSPNDPA